MRMFGLIGFAMLYTMHLLGPKVAFPVAALVNAVMCYVGPQRAELLIHPNVGPKHIVPHIVLTAVSLAAVLTRA